MENLFVAERLVQHRSAELERTAWFQRLLAHAGENAVKATPKPEPLSWEAASCCDASSCCVAGA